MRNWRNIFSKVGITAVMLLICLSAAAQQPVENADSVVVDELVMVPDSVVDEFAVTPDSVLLHMGQQEPNMRAQLAAADSIVAQVQNYLPREKFTPDPIRAMWLGLILPGGGQIYNRKYWKLPIIYGGFLGCIYALTWNNQMLSDYSQAYLDIMDEDPNTKSYEKMLPMGYDISGREDQFKEIFKNKKNYYRKYRDMSIFAFAAVHILAVIDAYVDAELSSFDISNDLSLKVTPAVISTHPQTSQHVFSSGEGQGVGMAFRLNF